MIRRPAICAAKAAALAALLCPLGAAIAEDDLEITFNDHCRECHSFLKDDNRLGPSLYGVVGRKAGTLAGYGYSESLRDSGVTWDEPTLDKWIADPNAVISGNQMSPPYNGVADAAIRKRIIAYLKTISPPDAGATP
jgi:cytochrome c